MVGCEVAVVLMSREMLRGCLIWVGVNDRRLSVKAVEMERVSGFCTGGAGAHLWSQCSLSLFWRCPAATCLPRRRTLFTCLCLGAPFFVSSRRSVVEVVFALRVFSCRQVTKSMSETGSYGGDGGFCQSTKLSFAFCVCPLTCSLLPCKYLFLAKKKCPALRAGHSASHGLSERYCSVSSSLAAFSSASVSMASICLRYLSRHS